MDEKLPEESDALSQAERLAEETRGLKWCLKHDLVVWFDGKECPACQLINENREEAAKVFLEMTKDLE